jgi:PAT family beta-lactamase induction signal transducer AmpG
MFPARRLVPEVEQDVEPTESQRGQFRGNLGRTLSILAFYAATYFSISAIWKLIANSMSSTFPGWELPKDAVMFGNPTGWSGVTGEFIQLGICAPLAIGLVFYLRKSLKGTEMGEAFSSFFRQSGIVPILCFLTFYRFSEAMVGKMSVLFLKDDLNKGGLALSNSQFGFIKGTIGVAGIIVGGIVGWIIALLMHLPILLYIYAAFAQPSNMSVVAFVEFIDQFGYGLGYAGYAVYLMRVAQRGNHRTAHYAIGTGLGATFIALSGIIGGQIQASSSYKTTFLAALLFDPTPEPELKPEA